MAVLEFLNGERVGDRLSVMGSQAVLGRHPECDIVLNEGAISRQHAKLSLRSGEYFIEDLQSRNGTIVNGELVETAQQLHDGDELKICDLMLRFHRESPTGDSPVLATLDADPFQVEDDGMRPGHSSTVMLKLDATATREASRLAVNPTTKLRALVEITQNLSRATALDQILPKVLDSLFNIFPQADRGFVVMTTPEGRLIPRAFKQRNTKSEEGARLSRTIINEVVKLKQAILSADAASDARFELSQSIADFRIRSMMCAPLVTSESNVLGVIQIDTLDQRARFVNDDLEVLASVASQAAFAVDNAQMHERQLKQQSIQRDLELAHKVQRGLLPTAPPKVEGYQFFDFYEAANQVGGDFYDYIPLRDGRVAVVLADVSGKGVSAALVMARLSAEVRYWLASEPSAATAVSKINESFCQAGWEDRFVTFVLALLDPREHRVTIVNAGHMPPFVRHQDKTVETVAPDIAGLPLGVADGISYDAAEVTLKAGETLTLFTDGISEALNPANELYTLERLQRRLGGAADDNAAELGRSVLDDVKRHAAGYAQSDDMCLVVFGRNT
jgi:sigma-B regulation protein RsbU (phosphoserine phosphatase)